MTKAISNNFIIEFTEPAVVTGGGGSSGGTNTQLIPVSLKIIVPNKISTYQNEKITVSLSLFNPGKRMFSGLALGSSVLKDGKSVAGIKASLDRNYIAELKAGEKENITLTIFFGTESRIGDYEVYINVSSQSPKYTDWAKIQINLQRINESRIKEKLLFTNELIVQNPACIEIKEVVDEAQKYFEAGDYANAELKTEQAINACQESIAQVSLPRPPEQDYRFWSYFILLILASFLFGAIYYFMRRRRLKNRKEVMGAEGISGSYVS
jgi:hypothetical protein